MQAGLILPGSARGDSRREKMKREGEKEGGGKRLQAGDRRQFPIPASIIILCIQG